MINPEVKRRISTSKECKRRNKKKKKTHNRFDACMNIGDDFLFVTSDIITVIIG